VNFISYPLYTHFLAPEDLGYYDLSIAYGTMIGSFFLMDVWVGVMKRVMAADSRKESDSSIRSGFVVVLGAVFIMAVIAAAIEILSPVDHLWYVLACTAATGLQNYWSFLARAKGENLVFAISGVIGAVMSFVLSLSLLELTSLGNVSLYIGLIMGACSQVFFLEFRLRVLISVFTARVDWKSLRSLVLFSLPLAINSASYWIATGAGRIGISRELSLFDNGIYAAASKLGSIVGLLAGVITMVWQQASFVRSAKDREFFANGMRSALGVYMGGTAIAIPVGIVAYQTVVASEYASGLSTIPGFVVVAVLAGYQTFVGNIFYAIERTATIFYSTLVVLLTVVFATVPLVRTFGIDGANAALAIGYVLGIVVRVCVLRRSAKIESPVLAELISLIVLFVVWLVFSRGAWALGGVCLVCSLGLGVWEIVKVAVNDGRGKKS
jgi:O-antigen/teichoic acid export membrane protein